MFWGLSFGIKLAYTIYLEHCVGLIDLKSEYKTFILFHFIFSIRLLNDIWDVILFSVHRYFKS